MKKILFPTDFSDRANKALTQSVDFAEKLGLEMIIHHAYHRPMVEGDANQQLAGLHHIEKNIDSKFNELLEQNRQLKKGAYEFRKHLDVSVESIISASQKEEIGLILMATKGANGFEELWGTKTAQIVKNVNVPVLVIPDDTSLTMSKIGLFCDYSAEADYHTLDFLLGIAEKLSLDIDVITLNKDEELMSHQEKSYRSLVRKKLESVQTTFKITFHTHVDRGIIDYSKANNIGLIAILPKSYNFIEHLFHESLTEKMIFRSPIPLLVLK